MPRASRDSVHLALFNLLTQTTLPAGLQFELMARRIVSPDKVDVISQPALLLDIGAEIALQKNPKLTSPENLTGVTSWLWHYFLYIYFQMTAITDLVNVPAIVISAYRDALEKQMSTKTLAADGTTVIPKHRGERQTLGLDGIYHCWLDGTQDFQDTSLNAQGIIISRIALLTGI